MAQRVVVLNVDGDGGGCCDGQLMLMKWKCNTRGESLNTKSL